MSNTVRTIRLEGELGEKFGEIWKLNVSTPVDDTVYWLTGNPLKLKLNGILWFEDQAGDVTDGPRIEFHPAGRPFPLGYSLSLFNPPGL